MLYLEIAGQMIGYERNIAFVDTNIMLDAFSDDEEIAELSKLMLIEGDYQVYVPWPVVVEACGMLSKRESQLKRQTMLNWLLQPSTPDILPSPHHADELMISFGDHVDYMRQCSIDYVDAHLMEIAHRFTIHGDLKPAATILTRDQRDFLRLFKKKYHYSLDNLDDQRVEDDRAAD